MIPQKQIKEHEIIGKLTLSDRRSNLISIFIEKIHTRQHNVMKYSIYYCYKNVYNLQSKNIIIFYTISYYTYCKNIKNSMKKKTNKFLLLETSN